MLEVCSELDLQGGSIEDAESVSSSVVKLIGVYALSTVVSPSGNGGIEGGGGGFRRWDEKRGRPSGVWRGGGQAGAGRMGDARMLDTTVNIAFKC